MGWSVAERDGRPGQPAETRERAGENRGWPHEEDGHVDAVLEQTHGSSRLFYPFRFTRMWYHGYTGNREYGIDVVLFVSFPPIGFFCDRSRKNAV